VAVDEKTQWQAVTIKQWYGQGPKEVEIATQTAVWYHTGKPVVPIRWVLIRDLQGKFETQALLSTELRLSALEIVSAFVQRWHMEVTFEEARAHLGMETQRQWNDLAISRTTPVLLGLYSIVTLMAQGLGATDRMRVRQSAWYVKNHATFSDTMSWVRRYLWATVDFSMSSDQTDMVKIPRPLVERFIDAVRYAAWEQGVRATSICPGLVDTDMTADVTTVPRDQMIPPSVVAHLVATALAMPNTASVAEIPINCVLEPSL